jgi:hypothetical protein
MLPYGDYYQWPLPEWVTFAEERLEKVQNWKLLWRKTDDLVEAVEEYASAIIGYYPEN